MSETSRNKTRQPKRQVFIDADVDVDSAFEKIKNVRLKDARLKENVRLRPEWGGGRMAKHGETYHNQFHFTLEKIRVQISPSVVSLSYHPSDETSFWHVLTVLHNLGICHPSQMRNDNNLFRRFTAEKVAEEFKKKTGS